MVLAVFGYFARWNTDPQSAMWVVPVINIHFALFAPTRQYQPVCGCTMRSFPPIIAARWYCADRPEYRRGAYHAPPRVATKGRQAPAMHNRSSIFGKEVCVDKNRASQAFSTAAVRRGRVYDRPAGIRPGIKPIPRLPSLARRRRRGSYDAPSSATRAPASQRCAICLTTASKKACSRSRPTSPRLQKISKDVLARPIRMQFSSPAAI